MPDALEPLECGLHGPIMGDEPISETEVTYAVRGKRCTASRFIDRPKRPTRQVTVIAGEHDGRQCVLFTAFGGPSAPREPGDSTLKSWEEVCESRKFWAEHALSNT